MERKKLTFFILIAVLIGIILGILIWKILSPKLGEGAFYYHVDGDKANLFLLSGKGEGEKIATVPAQEIDLGKYRPPKYTFISPNGTHLIYFQKTEEKPIETIDQNTVMTRILYKPMLLTLKTSTEKEINQSIDPTEIVFSSDNNQIAWIKEIKESTFEEIDKANIQRELWVSRIDGENARLLTTFNEGVVLLRRWSDNYIYFEGIYGIGNRSLGRVNTANKKVEYILPEKCNKELSNCQNIEFSPSGKMFLYEIYTKKDDNKEITELYLGDFESRKYKPILTTDRISDKHWLDDERGFFYTEQEMVRNEGAKETIHLVDLYKETEKEIYTGSYISQLVYSGSENYLYFLENDNGNEVNRFKLMRMNIKNNQSDTVLIENYFNILLIQ